jgi:hypothetical protein
MRTDVPNAIDNFVPANVTVANVHVVIEFLQLLESLMIYMGLHIYVTRRLVRPYQYLL